MSSIKNSTFMNVNKTSNSIRNIIKENSIVEKNSEQKVNKIKSELHHDLFWTFRILIMFFKFIGLATFAYRIVIHKKRTSYIFQYSKLGIVYNVVLSSLMIASNYISIPLRLTWEYKIKTNLTIVIAVLQTVLGTLAICVILISYCIKQKSLVQIANRLITIEHEIDRLYDLYHPLRRQRTFCTMIIICILKICLLMLLLFNDNLALGSTLVSWLTDIVPTFYVGWLLIQYFLLVMVIQTDFVDVNRAIQNLTRINTPDRLQSLYQTRRMIVNNSTVHQLLQLRDVHCRLCEISKDISNFYSLPVLFGIVFLFLTLIYNSYFLFWILLITDDIIEYETLSNTIIWIIFLIYPIFLLTNKITKILIEMKKTSNIAHDLLNCAVEKETKAEVKKSNETYSETVFIITIFIIDMLQLKKFSLQLLHRKIQFTANGYFTLDNTFLHSLTGTVVIYLIIFVQFQIVSSRSSITAM